MSLQEDDALQATDIQIVAEPTANPHVYRFTTDHTLNDAGSVRCTTREEAAGSPLLENLFAVDDVREVLVVGDTVTVAKAGIRSWQEVGSEIGAAVREALVAGRPLFAASWHQSTPEEDRIRQRIEAVFAAEVNPAIAGHGGFVRLVDVKGTNVHLALGGGCQGCASSQVTLRGGIERAIRKAAPEVNEIIDVTDHTAGANPYYSRTEA